MEHLDFNLPGGMKLGERRLQQITIRESTVQDTLDAAAEMTGGSPLELQIGVMRRRIVAAEDMSGLISAALIGSMPDIDFQLMMEAVEEFDAEREKAARKILAEMSPGRGLAGDA